LYVGEGLPLRDGFLDPVQSGDSPSERGQGLQRAAGDPAAPGHVGLGIGDGKGQPFSFGEPAALPADPLPSLLCRGACGKAANERDVRIVPQLEGEMYVVVGQDGK
jgi:hypothetical protein